VIRHSKQADEKREAERREGGTVECWCLHGAVGMAADWRESARRLAAAGVATRAVDLWRFLEEEPVSIASLGRALNADAAGELCRAKGRALVGYSMGGRLALHALLEEGHPWQAAVIVSAHPGLETMEERMARQAADADWAARALMGDWRQFLEAWHGQSVLGGDWREPALSEALARHRREIARSFVDWSLGAQEPLWQRLAEIRVPVLWITGSGDAKFTELARRAVGSMPQAELVVAAGAGHRVPWEAAEWFEEQVAGFLHRCLA
jgi:2-succinyl-6-hydroxy-2,4-cyclohexadiene-1-carboxylate synthase